MQSNLTTEDIKRWSRQAAVAAEEKLGKDTVLLDVGALVGITDVFVITSGSNYRQVRAIVEEIQEQMLLLDGPKPQTIEGKEVQEGSIWVLMDYGGFIVHVFDDETRDLYDLERLWNDCPRIDWESLTEAIEALD